MVSNLITTLAEPDADIAGLQRLALWALRRYSPIVAVDPPNGLLIDSTGATHITGGAQALLDILVARLGTAGITARTAMAPTVGAAHALVRYRTTSSLIADTEALTDLPIAALRLPALIVRGLHRLGFERIGALEATPRAPLALRFGAEPGRRLDQAFGRQAEPITPARAPDTPLAQHDFAEPIVAVETISRNIEKLVAILCAELETRCLGARRLDLLFHRVDASLTAIRIGTARPLRDAKRLARLLCEKLGIIDPGFGIEAMILLAPIVEPLTYQPTTTRLGEAPIADISTLIDTLVNRVGAGRIYRFAAVESDVPERAVRRILPLAPPTRLRWSLNYPRPSRLLAHPEQVETLALLPDSSPVHFTWRGIRRHVRRADGPERLYGEWGHTEDETNAVRDYFQVEDDTGERFWLFRTGDGANTNTGPQQWFLHGLF